MKFYKSAEICLTKNVRKDQKSKNFEKILKNYVKSFD